MRKTRSEILLSSGGQQRCRQCTCTCTVCSHYGLPPVSSLCGLPPVCSHCGLPPVCSHRGLPPVCSHGVVKPPTGKSFRFVRVCERARRGETVWASERRFDCEARAVVRRFYLLLCSENMPGGLSTKNLVFAQGFSRFSRTTLLKPMKKQHRSRTTL